MSPYGERIHQLLRKAGMSQSKLAGDIDVLPNHLSQVINGQKGPFKEDIQSRISDILKLSDVERNELSQLADISRTSFKMRRGARPEEYRIVALFSDHSPFTAEMYIKVARLALAAYEESVPTTRGNTERRVEM